MIDILYSIFFVMSCVFLYNAIGLVVVSVVKKYVTFEENELEVSFFSLLWPFIVILILIGFFSIGFTAIGRFLGIVQKDKNKYMAK